MSWPEKEYDAYARTEEWTIKNNLPSQNPAFRTEGPIRAPLLKGPTIVDLAAIKKQVDEDYPFIPPSSPGGPTPPQVTGKTPDGRKVIMSDGSKRPPKEGDTFPAKNPRNPKNAKEVPPKDIKCP